MDSPTDKADTHRMWGEMLGGLSFLIGLVVLLNGICMAAFSVHAWSDEHQFHQDGTIATPRIVEKTHQKVWVDDEGWTTLYWLHYAYTDSTGNVHVAKKPLTQPIWNQSAVGELLPSIEYSQSQPTMHRIASADGQWREFLEGSAVCAGIGLMILFISYVLHRRLGHCT